MNIFRSKDSGLKNSSSKVQNAVTDLTLNSFVNSTPQLRHSHLLNWQRYSGLGFSVLQNRKGVYVKDVEKTSPADLGGLKVNDKILEVNGKKIKRSRHRKWAITEINKYKSIGGTNNRNYLNILVADPATYLGLKKKRTRNLSTSNRRLNIKDIYTPDEQPLKVIENLPLPPPNKHIAPVFDNTPMIIKRCVLHRPLANENQSLGYEITKRGNNPHVVTQVDFRSVAALSGVEIDDNLIELNDRNVERDETSLLKEKIAYSMRPENGGKIVLTSLNKKAYDHCIRENIPFSEFIRKNDNLVRYHETPSYLWETIKLPPSQPAPTTFVQLPPVQLPPVRSPTPQAALNDIFHKETLKPILKTNDYHRDYNTLDKNVKINDDVYYSSGSHQPGRRAYISSLYNPVKYNTTSTTIVDDYSYTNKKHDIIKAAAKANDYDTRSLGGYDSDRYKSSSKYINNYDYDNDWKNSRNLADSTYSLGSKYESDDNLNTSSYSLYRRSEVDIISYF